MKSKAIWTLLEEIFDTLGSYGFPAMAQAAAELQLEPGWFTWIAAIWLFGSEPITTAAFMRMLPYGLARLHEERFVAAVQQGYLVSDGKGGYIPTTAGMSAAQKVWREAGDALKDLPMPEASQHSIFDILARLGEASLSAPEPPSHFFITHKRENYQRFEILHPSERFVVLFGELAAYRDDAHISAWQMHNIEGNRWEVLTTLWRGEANTLDQLFTELKFRGISRAEYAQLLAELIERGWVAESSGAYELTTEGKRTREDAEALTDRFFFAPWACLNAAEQEDLLVLATQLRDSLRRPPA